MWLNVCIKKYINDQGGEPDLATAAKMILHDWQRGKIPFFVPPPHKEEGDSSEKPNSYGVDEEAERDSNKKSAALKAIAIVISSQQQRSVPVQRDLFSENELKCDDASDDAEISVQPSEMGDDDDRTTDEDDTDDEDETDEEDETCEA